MQPKDNQGYYDMFRFIDVGLAMIGLLALFPLLIVVTILGFFDTGSPIFIQTRVGKHQRPFKLYKFRTMNVETKSVASHLASSDVITVLGGFLRKSKIDELPQLLNVLLGDMSIVGPRPNLFNQKELILERELLQVYDVLPGITGLAQIKKIDMSDPCVLAKLDRKMIDSLSIRKYFYYIFMTVSGSGGGDRVKDHS